MEEERYVEGERLAESIHVSDLLKKEDFRICLIFAVLEQIYIRSVMDETSGVCFGKESQELGELLP